VDSAGGHLIFRRAQIMLQLQDFVHLMHVLILGQPPCPAKLVATPVHARRAPSDGATAAAAPAAAAATAAHAPPLRRAARDGPPPPAASPTGGGRRAAG
jgi:hypothetical protein